MPCKRIASSPNGKLLKCVVATNHVGTERRTVDSGK